MGKRLTWEEIKKNYPDTFVLINNCEEQHLPNQKCLFLKGEVIFTTKDGKEIFNEYRRRGKPSHMTFGHTCWDKLESEEISFMGLRFSNEPDTLST